MEQQQSNSERRRIAEALMTAFGVKDRRIVWSFLRHCDDEPDMENSLRALRKNDKGTGWFH